MMFLRIGVMTTAVCAAKPVREVSQTSVARNDDQKSISEEQFTPGFHNFASPVFTERYKHKYWMKRISINNGYDDDINPHGRPGWKKMFQGNLPSGKLFEKTSIQNLIQGLKDTIPKQEEFLSRKRSHWHETEKKEIAYLKNSEINTEPAFHTVQSRKDHNYPVYSYRESKKTVWVLYPMSYRLVDLLRMGGNEEPFGKLAEDEERVKYNFLTYSLARMQKTLNGWNFQTLWGRIEEEDESRFQVWSPTLVDLRKYPNENGRTKVVRQSIMEKDLKIDFSLFDTREEAEKTSEAGMPLMRGQKFSAIIVDAFTEQERENYYRSGYGNGQMIHDSLIENNPNFHIQRFSASHLFQKRKNYQPPRKEEVLKAITEMAENSQAGDVNVIFIGTHGQHYQVKCYYPFEKNPDGTTKKGKWYMCQFINRPKKGYRTIQWLENVKVDGKVIYRLHEQVEVPKTHVRWNESSNGFSLWKKKGRYGWSLLHSTEFTNAILKAPKDVTFVVISDTCNAEGHVNLNYKWTRSVSCEKLRTDYPCEIVEESLHQDACCTGTGECKPHQGYKRICKVCSKTEIYPDVPSEEQARIRWTGTRAGHNRPNDTARLEEVTIRRKHIDEEEKWVSLNTQKHSGNEPNIIHFAGSTNGEFNYVNFYKFWSVLREQRKLSEDASIDSTDTSSLDTAMERNDQVTDRSAALFTVPFCNYYLKGESINESIHSKFDQMKKKFYKHLTRFLTKRSRHSVTPTITSNYQPDLRKFSLHSLLTPSVGTHVVKPPQKKEESQDVERKIEQLSDWIRPLKNPLLRREVGNIKNTWCQKPLDAKDRFIMYDVTTAEELYEQNDCEMICYVGGERYPCQVVGGTYHNPLVKWTGPVPPGKKIGDTNVVDAGQIGGASYQGQKSFAQALKESSRYPCKVLESKNGNICVQYLVDTKHHKAGESVEVPDKLRGFVRPFEDDRYYRCDVIGNPPVEILKPHEQAGSIGKRLESIEGSDPPAWTVQPDDGSEPIKVLEKDMRLLSPTMVKWRKSDSAVTCAISRKTVCQDLQLVKRGNKAFYPCKVIKQSGFEVIEWTTNATLSGVRDKSMRHQKGDREPLAGKNVIEWDKISVENNGETSVLLESEPFEVDRVIHLKPSVWKSNAGKLCDLMEVKGRNLDEILSQEERIINDLKIACVLAGKHKPTGCHSCCQYCEWE